MKRKRFSVEQITTVLKQAETGVPIGELCRQVGISEQTFYRWRKVYGNLQPSEARELKQLRDENTRLKRLVADLTLDKVMLQDVVKKSGETGPPARGRAVFDRALRDQRTTGVSDGAVLPVEPPAPEHRDPLVALRHRMREVAQARLRYGYRRLWVVLRREGWDVGKHRFYRVYCEEGLALRRKRPWRHATAVHREQRRAPAARNDIWSMDFVADALSDGRRFRALTVIDLYTRECLEIVAGRRLRGEDVAAALERLRFARGLPQRIYCDNGSEFVSATMDRWAYTNGVALDFSRRGKPTDNATIESFNGRFREECLNVHWFASIEDAQVKIDAWRWDYNEHHPHRALKGLSPREYARRAMVEAAASSS